MYRVWFMGPSIAYKLRQPNWFRRYLSKPEQYHRFEAQLARNPQHESSLQIRCADLARGPGYNMAHEIWEPSWGKLHVCFREGAVMLRGSTRPYLLVMCFPDSPSSKTECSMTGGNTTCVILHDRTTRTNYLQMIQVIKFLCKWHSPHCIFTIISWCLGMMQI